MSAFVVDPKTINVIVTALVIELEDEGRGIYPTRFPDLRYLKSQSLHDAAGNPEELGAALYAMNINAVEQCYPDCIGNPDNLPGKFSDGQHLDRYEFIRTESTPIQVFKSLSCYLYQCTEGDVDELPLYKALSEFKTELAEHIIKSTPEYDSASWG